MNTIIEQNRRAPLGRSLSDGPATLPEAPPQTEPEKPETEPDFEPDTDPSPDEPYREPGEPEHDDPGEAPELEPVPGNDPSELPEIDPDHGDGWETCRLPEVPAATLSS